MTDKKRIQYKSSSILAKDTFISNDTWETGINNNVLVVGPSGAGKTRSYVKPNIMQANTNMIVSDAKGTLYRETAPLLRANGYEVWHLDFVNMNMTLSELSMTRRTFSAYARSSSGR